MAGRKTTGIRALWPKTRRDWTFVVFCAFAFLALNVLALLGSDLAWDLLISLSGALVGLAAARLATYPFRKKPGVSGVGRIFGLFVGLALVFVIIFGGTALAGIPAYPTAEGGNVGNMIYGFAMGVLVGIPGGLAPAERKTPGPPSRSGFKVVAIILGTVAALFGLLFVLFLLIEYVAVPLIRALAG